MNCVRGANAAGSTAVHAALKLVVLDVVSLAHLRHIYAGAPAFRMDLR